jgi:hypothetical protein
MDEVDKPNPYGSGTDMEKDYQIKNMANIYRWCDAVCILVGGLGAVQTVDIASHYINRAWTLEESTINLNDNIWAIVKWPYPTTFTITSLTPNLSVNFINVHGQFYRIPFKTLLNFPRVLQGYTIPPISFPNNFKVRCLNGIEKSKMKRTAKVALRYYYSKYNKTGRSAEHARRAAIWRSMLLRTVSNPNDVVYSVEGIISADDPVDPDRDHRTVQELFNDLALKAAARGRPDWLSIGPVYGSPIPRDTESRLIYRVPTYPPHQHTPYYKKGNGSKVYTGDLIGQEQGYIRLYNIKFISISVPHLVCAVIIKVKNATSPKSMLNTPEGNRYKFQMNVSGVGSRQCVYSGKPSGTALLIGLVGSFNNNGQSIYKGNTAIIFIKRKNYEWIVTGNGCYDISQASWPNGKVHLRIGKGAKSKGKPTKCDCNSGTSNKKLHSSWGIVPIADFIQTGSSRPIIWVGKKVRALAFFSHSRLPLFDSVFIVEPKY